jgi:hypothetical protein
MQSRVAAGRTQSLSALEDQSRHSGATLKPNTMTIRCFDWYCGQKDGAQHTALSTSTSSVGQTHTVTWHGSKKILSIPFGHSCSLYKSVFFHSPLLPPSFPTFVNSSLSKLSFRFLLHFPFVSCSFFVSVFLLISVSRPRLATIIFLLKLNPLFSCSSFSLFHYFLRSTRPFAHSLLRQPIRFRAPYELPTVSVSQPLPSLPATIYSFIYSFIYGLFNDAVGWSVTQCRMTEYYGNNELKECARKRSWTALTQCSSSLLNTSKETAEDLTEHPDRDVKPRLPEQRIKTAGRRY